MALLILLTHSLTLSALHHQDCDAPGINHGGRQRMLSQKLTKEALLLAQAAEPEEREGHRRRLADTLAVELDRETPPVVADVSRLEQVAANYLSNAIKFSPPNADVTVRTHGTPEAVRLEVIDGGPGLTEQDLKKAFRKYENLSARPTTQEKSSGLGLAICKELVERHGGEVGVQNNPERGATFWFTIPLDGNGHHDDAPLPAARARQAAS